MISKKTKYAPKALGYLAEHSRAIQFYFKLAKENIPKKLEAILVALRKVAY
jgi:DNA-binding IscR family transcriptional regulator